jgi:hypothetical protein
LALDRAAPRDGTKGTIISELAHPRTVYSQKLRKHVASMLAQQRTAHLHGVEVADTDDASHLTHGPQGRVLRLDNHVALLYQRVG